MPAEEPQRLVAWPDVRRAASLVVGAAVCGVTPQRADPLMAAWVDRAAQRLSPATVPRIAEKMRRALPADQELDAEAAALAFRRMFVEDALARTRGLWRHGWRPELRIQGLERLDRALERGRGAILWGLRFASSTAIKQAFHRIGRPLIHLSRRQHGSPTTSRFGLGVTAPLYCRAENPYLAERIVIPLNRSPRYLQILRARLRDNQTISIFAEHEGQQNIVAPVLTAEFPFAMGAPSLAWSEDAALLTVSAHREGPFRYRIEIGDEIPVRRSLTRKAFAAEAVAELATRLERLIVRDPSDWQGWMYREFPERR